MPKIDNPIADQEQIPEDQPAYPGLQIEEDLPAAYDYAPPAINTLIAPYVVAVQQIPYNRVSFFTFQLLHATPAIRIVEQQPIGIAGKVTIYTPTTGAKILLSNRRENLTTSVNGTTSQTGSLNASLISTMQPLVLLTCNEIWAEEVSQNTDSEITVILETYDRDLYMQELGRYYPYDKVPINQQPSDY